MSSQMDLVRKPDTAKYYLKWNNFESQLVAGFSQLYHSKSLSDVTLVCEGNSIKAHKLVLSLYSPYLRMILTGAPGKHPMVTIDGVKMRDLVNVLEFLYLGKVCVKHEDIESFVETAQFLHINGVPGKKTADLQVVEGADKLTQDTSMPWSIRAISTTTSALPHPDLTWVSHEENKPDSPQVSHPSPVELSPPTNVANEPAIIPEPRGYPSYPKRPWYQHRPSTHGHPPYPLPPPQHLVNCVGPIQNPFMSKAYAHYFDRGPVIREVGAVSPGRCSEESNDEPLDMQVKTTDTSIGKSTSSSNEALKLSNLQPLVPTRPSPPQDIELFTTPSGMVVSTAFNSNKRSPARFAVSHPVTVIQDRRLYSTRMADVIHRPPPLLAPPASNPLCLTNKSRKEPECSTTTTVGVSSSNLIKASSSCGQHYSKAIKYTPSQVKALVQSVDGLVGPFVPCRICQKVVKRERLRTHIYECHLVNGEKITCQYCGVALKSKGSYRVHVWRHRNGNLKKNKPKARSNSE